MDAIAQVVAALDVARLVTVVGPPGIGKSHVAERACPRDGLLVLCDGVRDALDLEQRVAAELELAPGFRPPCTWMLLDGLAADVHALLGRWLAQGARLLVTREAPLGLEAEVVVEVPPLTAEAGERFMLDRVDRPLWASTPRQRRALRTLVDQLGGRPALLEVVARRADVAQPSELVTVSPALAAEALAFGPSYAALSPADRRTLHVLAAMHCPVRPDFLAKAVGPDWSVRVDSLTRLGWLGLGAGGLVLSTVSRTFVDAQPSPEGLPDVDGLLVDHLRGRLAEVEHYASHLRRSTRADALEHWVEWLTLVDAVAAARLLRGLGPALSDPRLSSRGAVVARDPDELEAFLAYEGTTDADPRSAFRFRFARARAKVLWDHVLDDSEWPGLDAEARRLGLVADRVRLLHLLTHLHGMRVEILRARRAFDDWLELVDGIDHPVPLLLARASRAHFAVDVGEAGARAELADCARAVRARGLVPRAIHYEAMLAYDSLGTGSASDRVHQLKSLRDQLRDLGDRGFSNQVDLLRLCAEVDAGLVDPAELEALATDQASGGSTRLALTARILSVAAAALKGQRAGLDEAAREVRELGAIPPERAILHAVDALASGRPYEGPPPRAVFERHLVRWARLAASPALKVDSNGFAEVDLARRPVQRRLWNALWQARRAEAGRCLTAEALVEAVWPGERMAWSSARNRLYVALSYLRKSGLGELLQSREGGWRLDPTVRLEARSLDGTH